MSNTFGPNGHNLDASQSNNNLIDFIRILQQQQQQQQQNDNDNSSFPLEPLPINQFQPFVSQEGSQVPAQQQHQQLLPPEGTPQALNNNMGITPGTSRIMAAMRERDAPTMRPGGRFVGRGLTERQQFLIFVKILLKYVERTNNPQLQRTAKAVVAECTRRNRMGDAEYMPLQAAVERHLRVSLGEVHWSRAKLCFDTYLARQGIRTIHINAPAISAV
uniref:Uncharacterized protein n=1 Tax=Amphora coffeiformis TaxID=265554 RepID=A0A7S3P5H5_9STRA